MKIEQRTAMIPQVIQVYIAADGHEFNSEDECREYEENGGLKVIKDVMSVPHAIRGASSVECMCDREDDLILIFKPRDQLDIELINQLLILSNNDQWVILEDEMQKYIDGGICLFGYDEWRCDFDISTHVEFYFFVGTIDELKASYINSIDRIVEEELS